MIDLGGLANNGAHPALDRWAVKATRPDFRTRDGFQWAFPGGWTTDPADEGTYTTRVCPSKPGDGLSVAKTLSGMTQGGYSPSTVLVVGFAQEHVIAEDFDKLKVSQAYTLCVWDGIGLIQTRGRGADLGGANLRDAYGNSKTTWPDGFDAAKAGVISV